MQGVRKWQQLKRPKLQHMPIGASLILRYNGEMPCATVNQLVDGWCGNSSCKQELVAHLYEVFSLHH
jgi:hypothetical protein